MSTRRATRTQHEQLDAHAHAYKPELVGLISEALSAASDVFGERASFRLEPFVDPESPDPSTRVYLVLSTELSVDEADGLMEELDDRWWLDNSHRIGGLLSMAIEYV